MQPGLAIKSHYMTPITPQELAELTELMKEGSPSLATLKKAVAAVKPKRALSADAKSLRSLKASVTEAEGLITEIMRLRRALDAMRQEAQKRGRRIPQDAEYGSSCIQVDALEAKYRQATEYIWLGIRTRLDEITPKENDDKPQ